jgi:hypothetical protein
MFVFAGGYEDIFSECQRISVAGECRQGQRMALAGGFVPFARNRYVKYFDLHGLSVFSKIDWGFASNPLTPSSPLRSGSFVFFCSWDPDSHREAG